MKRMKLTTPARQAQAEVPRSACAVLLILACCGAQLWTPASALGAEPAKKRTNIIFVLADDKYECPPQNVTICPENATFLQQMVDPQISLNCRQSSAIAGN